MIRRRPMPHSRTFVHKAKAGDTVCQICGLPNPPWFIDSKFWNLVVSEKVGILCLRCFAEQAHNCGVTGCWRLVPDPETNSLVLGETPVQRRMRNDS